jgi:hypothetical protein
MSTNLAAPGYHQGLGNQSVFDLVKTHLGSSSLAALKQKLCYD